MSMPAHPEGSHEFVVAPELADVAERLGVPLHAGDRVRFEVIHGGAEVSRGESAAEGQFRGSLAGLPEPTWEDFETASALAREEFGFA